MVSNPFPLAQEKFDDPNEGLKKSNENRSPPESGLLALSLFKAKFAEVLADPKTA